MRIAICDDNALDRTLIMDLLQQYLKDRSIRCELTGYEDGVTLICDMEDGLWFDAVFLDIYMKELLGIEVARKLRSLHYDGAIVFLTGTKEFAVDSYEVSAFGYLLKPHSAEKIYKLMDRLTHDFDISAYQVQQWNRLILIPYNDIQYVESSNSKCILHSKGGATYNIYKRLDTIEQELNDPRFLRSHQSFLVNMDYIRQADKHFELLTGDIVSIRQRDLKAIRQQYLDYIEKKSASDSDMKSKALPQGG